MSSCLHIVWPAVNLVSVFQLLLINITIDNNNNIVRKKDKKLIQFDILILALVAWVESVSLHFEEKLAYCYAALLKIINPSVYKSRRHSNKMIKAVLKTVVIEFLGGHWTVLTSQSLQTRSANTALIPKLTLIIWYTCFSRGLTLPMKGQL